MRKEFEEWLAEFTGEPNARKYANRHGQYTVDSMQLAWEAWQAARASSPALPFQASEIPRLVECLKKANENAEHFERQYYLLCDKLEEMEASAESQKSEENK